MINRLLILLSFICLTQISLGQSTEKTLYFISNSHLDTQWNWDVQTTINQYIPNTLTQNFPLLDKYSAFHFNFEAMIHYKWMKEYYPIEYERLKTYIKDNRWHVSGGSVNANDVMVPSAESIIRNFLYGQTFYKKEFGKKGGTDIMLPDCFGFPYSLPTLGKHCGVAGFHTAKLAWGSAYDYNSLAPFGIWKGVDGSEIYAVFKGEAYDEHEKYNKDMSNDADMLNVINSNESKYGIPAAFRYVGPRSDRGGGLQDNPEKTGENTPYWLQTSVNSNGPVKVKLTSPDTFFEQMDLHRNEKYFVWDNELPMSTHGVGCYTSQTILKYWNRKNELLADATEKSSTVANWLGGLKYQSDVIRDSWTNLLWHQFHDDLTGTSIPNAYNFTYNDQVLVNLNLSKTLTNSIGSIVKQMDTQAGGIPLVVFNPLSIARTDLVEISLKVAQNPSGIRILNKDGNDVLTQIINFNSQTGILTFIFKADVPALGYETFELRLNESKNYESTLTVTNNMLENELFTVILNSKGDVASIFDKEQNKELLLDAIRMAFFNNRSESWPAWEILWTTVNTNPAGYVDENTSISIAENGPLRVSLKVSRSKNGSEFVQYIRLTRAEISQRIDFVNEVNWQSRGMLLKAVFPLRAANQKATYDLSIGTIERGLNTSRLYEVAGHQWADQMHTDGSYGISILNDCKYGWDKPNNSTLRLTLIHTPSVSNNYTHQKDQDLGLNKFTYSFFRHLGAWGQETQWEASQLNQPLIVFQAPKHAGNLGKSFGFATINSNEIAIKALKKAEETDELIVRVYELCGKNHSNVTISFPSEIVSAREVNGIEEEIGLANFSTNTLSFNINRFQPKTFAIRLTQPAAEINTNNPSSTPVTLNYNVDLMSFDSRKNNATAGVKYAYPAELIADVITVDGIDFAIGSRQDGNRNAVICSGQNISLPTGTNTKKLYILAASRNEKGTKANFSIDGVLHSFDIPYYAGNVGVWETEYNMGSELRRENIAFTASHRHNVADNRNDAYNMMYMYKYCINIDDQASTLTLPINQDVYVIAVSLSDNQNDDITPVSDISSLPEYADLNANSGDCNNKIEPQSVRSSHQNGTNEGPDKAIDNNLSTKWCVTNYNTPWLELTFAEPVEICRWFVMNAGNESFNSITSGFRLQQYSNGQWVDVDVVTNNTINKVSRTVTPFTTTRVRLQTDKGEQNGNTTRILEFAVYGKSSPTSVIGIPTAIKSDDSILGNYPNPFNQNTTIQCFLPENTTQVNLKVFDLSGNLLDVQSYKYAPIHGKTEIEWNSKTLNSGLYLYSVAAYNNNVQIYSAHNKMIINRKL